MSLEILIFGLFFWYEIEWWHFTHCDAHYNWTVEDYWEITPLGSCAILCKIVLYVSHGNKAHVFAHICDQWVLHLFTWETGL